MHTPTKRPASVWIAQLILGLFGMLALAGLILGVVYFGSNIDGPMLGAFALAALFQIFWLLLVLGAFWGLQKRKNWGRWLTVGILAYFVIAMFANTILSQPEGQSSAYRSGYMIGAMLVLIPVGYLIFRLAFGDAAVDFFTASDPDPESSLTPPPPPPNFDS